MTTRDEYRELMQQKPVPENSGTPVLGVLEEDEPKETEATPQD